MIPSLLVVIGAVGLAAGWLTMRRLGSRARLGRILASTPVVAVAQARLLAERGDRRYVGVRGRIDSDEEFEDEHGRPLVYRRQRLETRSGSTWVTAEEARQTAPFDVSEGLDTIAIDGNALDTGLIVVPREAEGVAGEIPDRLPPGTPPQTVTRLRIELLSSVDHALALGVPVLDPSRGPLLVPGLGRPLILTNLERDEALRLLAAGARGTLRLASGLAAGGIATAIVGVAWAILDGR